MHTFIDRFRIRLAAVVAGLAASLGAQIALPQTLPTLHLGRDVVIGGDKIDLKRLVGGRIGPTRTIYLSGIKGRELQVFGSDGEKRTTLGRYGSGPGDFHAMNYLGFVGDSIWITDGPLRRYTVYTTQDRLVGTHRIEKLIPPPDNSVKVPKTNGGFHVRAIFSDGSRWIFPEFPNLPAHALSVDGALIVTAIPSDLDVLLPMARITALRASGDTVFSRSVPVATPTIPDSVLNRVFRSNPRDSKEQAELRRTRPRPKFYPPLKDIFISTSGSVLIAFMSDFEHSSEGARNFATEREYLMLNATGKPVGRFKLPARTLVLQLNDDAIWASDFDGDDVPTIVRDRVTPP
ncbi:MAG: hypothetical protein ABJB74_02810 [Gemmatimonas sp.]